MVFSGFGKELLLFFHMGMKEKALFECPSLIIDRREKQRERAEPSDPPLLEFDLASVYE
jgi:hypothetical protein